MQNLLFSQKTALIGLLIWLIAVVFQFTTLQQEEWARLILLLAALVWLPLALPMISTKKYILEQALQYSILPSGILLAVGLFLPTGLLAAVLTFPWLLLTFLIALRGWHFFQSETRNIGVVAISAAHLFLIVGGAWTMADRLGIQPLNFDPAIVLLTGIHFHYAGFMFPFLAGLAAFNYPSVWLKVGCWLAVLAVPMTAAGITVMQLWEAPALEMSAAATVTLAGWSTAIGYLHLIQKNNKTGWVRFFWVVMSIALIASMTFAFLYAIRHWFLIEWLHIPAMRALHGSLNALLVTGGGLLGWTMWLQTKTFTNQSQF